MLTLDRKSQPKITFQLSNIFSLEEFNISHITIYLLVSSQFTQVKIPV